MRACSGESSAPGQLLAARRPQKAKWRRDATLKTMYEMGDITREEYLRDIETPVRVLPPKPMAARRTSWSPRLRKWSKSSIEGTEKCPGADRAHQHRPAFAARIESEMNEQLSALEGSPPIPAPGAPGTNERRPRPSRRSRGDCRRCADRPRRAWVAGVFFENQYDHISMARREHGALLQPLLTRWLRGSTSRRRRDQRLLHRPGTPTAQADLGLGNPATDLNQMVPLGAGCAGARPTSRRRRRRRPQLKPATVNEWFRKAGGGTGARAERQT